MITERELVPQDVHAWALGVATVRGCPACHRAHPPARVVTQTTAGGRQTLLKGTQALAGSPKAHTLP